MTRPARISIRLAALLILLGYEIIGPRANANAPTSLTASDISAGYALLYDLASKESKSSLLSIVKKESRELKSLLEKLSETSKTTAKELEGLARLNPPLNLKATHLPRIEQAARDSVDAETRKEIMHSQGVNLELRIVSSQLAGMNYAAHLARSLIAVETNPKRKEFLLRTDRKFSELHGQLYKMLSTRYQR